MRIVWTDEALDDLEEILAYYYVQAGPRIAGSIERRIVEQIVSVSPRPSSQGR
jgi:toxin ParE1/3/4